MADTSSEPVPPTDPRTLRKVAAAAVAGTVVEWFDFAIYGFLAPVIATTFFPASDRVAGLLQTFAVFAVAFAMRPLGGAVFGVIGDRIGRRRVLALTVVMMSGATTAIGLLPDHATAGATAAVLLTVARCVQGLSAGGEYAGACAYLVEHCPAGRRARYAGLLSSATFASFAMAALLSYALTTSLPQQEMADWGWRVPFLAAAPLGLVGFYIRRRLGESPVFQEALEGAAKDGSHAHSGLRATVREQWRSMLRLGGFIMLTALSFYTFSTYMTTFLRVEMGLDGGTVLWSNVVALTVAAGLAPFVGRVSDRVGRRPTMVAACVALGLLTIPAYLLAGQGTATHALAAQLLLATGAVTANVVTSVLLSEIFPTTVRYTASALTYNISYAIFGGTAPFVSTLLINLTGSRVSPAVYITAVAALALLAALSLPETSGRPLNGHRPPASRNRPDVTDARNTGPASLSRGDRR